MDSSYTNLPEKISINEFRVDFGTGQISTDTKIEVIEPKVMDLLRVLCGAPKQVHSAESLFEKVWPKSIYSPNSVRRNIALLRQALSDEDKTLIKTHPKRGYSLEASIKLIDGANGKTQQQDSSLEAEQPVLLKKKSLHLAFILLIVCIVAVSSVVLFNAQKPDIKLSNLSPITSSNDKERYMQVSPDGRYMAYIQSGPSQRRLLLKDLVTQKEWPLSQKDKAYTYLAWDVHLNSIVYSSKEQNSISFSRILLDAQRKPISEKILFERQDITWNSVFFIDDKQNLYYLANKNSSEHSRNASLYRHNLATGLSEALLEPSDEFKPYKIALSPTQNDLALIGFNHSGISEIKILNFNSKKISLVGEIDHNWHFLTWFEDERAILLSNGSQLNKIDLNGKISPLNYESFNFLVYPQIANDILYFVEAKTDQDILLAQLNKLAKPVTIIDSNTVDMFPAISNDKKTIAYVSLRNGLPQLFIKDLQSKQNRLIFENEDKEYALSEPIWDRTNKRLVSSINNKPFIVHLEETHQRIEWLESVIGVPKAWYQETDAILFVDKRTHNDELIHLDVSTRQVKPLNFVLGKQKVFLNNADSLIVFNGEKVTDAQSGLNLLTDIETIQEVYPQNNGFYFTTSDKGKTDLHFYQYESREVIKVKRQYESFDLICSNHCDQILSIFGDIVLLKKQKGFADILKLQLSTE
ncbi:hypothetical protein C1E23_12045 [Pseudoalteromonas phenolica]|uniref:OmpR/PhoB-type domain-containing protein n=1 Tax=Pseudoalteromonas phenolica TaxID=161398 RepID=A0A4Q7IMX3_9GAMM|nr:winged helix-turn-helix domain-containing protein [Pseudoalteromonas phenolica]RZQ52899.1 hypothetical protein C1E23_12045 [Pseudoalteromonas phenolica]